MGFGRLCSRFVKFDDRRLDDRAAIDVAAEDLRHMRLLPAHDLSDHILAKAGGVESGRRRSPQIVEVQIGETGRILGLSERIAEAFCGPWTAETMCQHCRRPAWNARQYMPQIVIERDSRSSPVPALARSENNPVRPDVRPRKTNNIAQSKTCMGGKINRIG